MNPRLMLFWIFIPLGGFPIPENMYLNLLPYFDNSTKRDYVINVGQTAYLHCRVGNLGDRAVSWIRKRDLHILTVGIFTYTNDQRFQSLHTDGSEEWTLAIASAQIRDGGIYECQVSTEPKISQSYHLSVVVSKATILGNSELFVRFKSDINLTCVVTETPNPPSFIYWYRGGKLINYLERGGINIVTEKQTRTSRLRISKVLPEDSGNYTCLPSSGQAASVFIHVLFDKQPEAMHHSFNLRGSANQKTHNKIIRLCLNLLIVPYYCLQNSYGLYLY
ncbi:myosin light chain kinase, smooth muscle-like [Diorhabda sublineata]|uniref:myosin light chain kinase, smooth muscle-like n=1 Tax=Diorhabda sublineata TaxID=1163346 RepID=UPI0024E09D2E|nr:myosin light chain kinase, smooth muscle-like [Diorhabda sublineata]XP_056645631.1 myosin light chain kinase, smooth muscle-like [Diorhabda sublineata]XP_056645632.1 myosin light chain kinase, smooth muscle-like [Diorhabda sublineata]XP_056645633.1 myosin light chain kinase, smooth muscle-like [Diorhabda sublineata]XP_056645634.1 myosin light chain kinase, smooth muscle-like [Diorhabda sublineata]